MKTVRILVFIAIVGFLASCGSKEKTETTTTTTVKTITPNKSEKKTTTTTTSASNGSSVIACANGSDKRTLEIVESNGGCELKYTKMGETNSVANSANGSAYCNSIKDRIIGKLEAAGHKCE